MNSADRRRVTDLRAKVKRAKADDVLSTEELALSWGVSKARFVTLMKDMAGLPDPQPAPKGQGYRPNTLVYAAKPSLEAMIAYATRHEDAAKAKAARTAAILGKGREAQDTQLHTPNELAVLNRLTAEIEAREREQGLYIPAAEVARVVGEVFSMLSEFTSTLSKRVDPHGDLPPGVRTKLDAKSRDLQLQLYRQVKHLLAPDAEAGANRESANRPRKARARRTRR